MRSGFSLALGTLVLSLFFLLGDPIYSKNFNWKALWMIPFTLFLLLFRKQIQRSKFICPYSGKVGNDLKVFYKQTERAESSPLTGVHLT